MLLPIALVCAGAGAWYLVLVLINFGRQLLIGWCNHLWLGHPINIWTKNFGWILVIAWCMKVKLLSFLPHRLHGCQHSLNILMSTSLSTLDTVIHARNSWHATPCHGSTIRTNNFPPHHTFTRQIQLKQIMYRSGQRSVVEWLVNQDGKQWLGELHKEQGLQRR